MQEKLTDGTTSWSRLQTDCVSNGVKVLICTQTDATPNDSSPSSSYSITLPTSITLNDAQENAAANALRTFASNCESIKYSSNHLSWIRLDDNWAQRETDNPNALVSRINAPVTYIGWSNLVNVALQKISIYPVGLAQRLSANYTGYIQEILAWMANFASFKLKVNSKGEKCNPSDPNYDYNKTISWADRLTATNNMYSMINNPITDKFCK